MGNIVIPHHRGLLLLSPVKTESQILQLEIGLHCSSSETFLLNVHFKDKKYLL